MGRAIESAAGARGHECVAIVDRAGGCRRVNRTIGGVSWRGIAVVFEFTGPSSARDHVIDLLRRRVAVVCGTTGWDASDPRFLRAARASAKGVIVAANFS